MGWEGVGCGEIMMIEFEFNNTSPQQLVRDSLTRTLMSMLHMRDALSPSGRAAHVAVRPPMSPGARGVWKELNQGTREAATLYLVE